MPANNVIVTRDVPRNSLLTALVDKYRTLAAPFANRVIGSINANITRTANAAGESALGDVIVDMQLAATVSVGYGEAVVAFMNPGGIRSDTTMPKAAAPQLWAKSIRFDRDPWHANRHERNVLCDSKQLPG